MPFSSHPAPRRRPIQPRHSDDVPYIGCAADSRTKLGHRGMGFERAWPYAAILGDFVAVGLDDTGSGRYRLTMRVTDMVSGAVLERSAMFEIR